MNPKLKTRLKRGAAYSGGFFAAFLLFLYLTFPYAALERILVDQAKAAGLQVSVGSLGPGLFGATASRVRVAAALPGVEVPPGIVIDTVRARPTLFPPGLAITAKSFGGGGSAAVGLFRRRPSVSVTVGGVDLARAGLKEAVGLDLAGTLAGRASLVLDATDLAKSKGEIEIDFDRVTVNGGTVQNYDLPRIAIGEVEGALKVEDGKATVEKFTAKGDDVEADADGEITLHARLPYSSPRLRVRFKPSPAFLDRYAIIKSGLAFAATPDPKGYYTLFVEGLLGNLRTRLQR